MCLKHQATMKLYWILSHPLLLDSYLFDGVERIESSRGAAGAFQIIPHIIDWLCIGAVCRLGASSVCRSHSRTPRCLSHSHRQAIFRVHQRRALRRKTLDRPRYQESSGTRNRQTSHCPSRCPHRHIQTRRSRATRSGTGCIPRRRRKEGVK